MLVYRTPWADHRGTHEELLLLSAAASAETISLVAFSKRKRKRAKRALE